MNAEGFTTRSDDALDLASTATNRTLTRAYSNESANTGINTREAIGRTETPGKGTEKGPRPHITVVHNYTDRSNVLLTTEDSETSVAGLFASPQQPYAATPQLTLTTTESLTALNPNPNNKNKSLIQFPVRLFAMLEQIEHDGLAHIASWQPHGRCFVIHRPALFQEHLLPVYFPSIHKLTSFQRQLNLYGFTRLSKGPDQGGYYHEYFLRYRPHLVPQVHRIQRKGTGQRARSNPSDEPNFYEMPFLRPVVHDPQHSTSGMAAPVPSTSGATDLNVLSRQSNAAVFGRAQGLLSTSMAIDSSTGLTMGTGDVGNVGLYSGVDPLVQVLRLQQQQLQQHNAAILAQQQQHYYPLLARSAGLRSLASTEAALQQFSLGQNNALGVGRAAASSIGNQALSLSLPLTTILGTMPFAPLQNATFLVGSNQANPLTLGAPGSALLGNLPGDVLRRNPTLPEPPFNPYHSHHP